MLAKANKLLNGPQTMGRGPAFWTGFVVVVLAAAAYPSFTDGWTVGNTVYFFNWIFMALGLSLIWGYGGALSFGQTAAVPEPATWALMLMGFGAVGFSMRRRRAGSFLPQAA